ncbi:hypothetical protein [Inquilinus sp.]|jgi:hypothetical protein|uniref:hypothetical protein n=1 Tax=Inquilinus sp. TaxID=1932117 RepID=UPI003783D115
MVARFTMLDLYSCYFPTAETNTLKGLVSWSTGRHPTVSATVADMIARNRGFAPLRQTIKDAVRRWGNTPTLGLRTSPIHSICTISSGT